jgi:HSP20 family protein
MFDSFLASDFRRWSTPAVNIRETDDSYKIEMAAPGMKKEDFKISVDNETLTISSEAKQEASEKNEHYSRKEFSFSSFTRSFNLPEFADTEKIAASYENGIMNIIIPKKEEARPKPPREIKVS